jgi:hypothetical protein
MKAIEVLAASGGLLLLAYLVDLAREKGVLLLSLAVSFLVLVALAIGGSVLWFRLVELPALHF